MACRQVVGGVGVGVGTGLSHRLESTFLRRDGGGALERAPRTPGFVGGGANVHEEEA